MHCRLKKNVNSTKTISEAHAYIVRRTMFEACQAEEPSTFLTCLGSFPFYYFYHASDGGEAPGYFYLLFSLALS